MFCSPICRRKCSIITELMDGDLHGLMQRRVDENSNDSPPFSIFEVVDILLQIGEGVNYLHQKRIVHRDLKSFNILVKSVKVTEMEIRYVHVKVADFGLSKTKDSSTRYSNQTWNTGTNRWMAPEIIKYGVGNNEGSRGSSAVPKYPLKCDVYSFGMVCYEVLTGEVPFPEQKNPNNVKKMVLQGIRPELPAHCPPHLKALIMECWHHEPIKRPSFAAICQRLKCLKYLLMTGLSSNPESFLITEDISSPIVPGAAGTSSPTRGIANDADDDDGASEGSCASNSSEVHEEHNADPKYSRVLKENMQLLQERACRVCKVAEASRLLLPCRHLCSCDSCEQELEDCPLCRTHKNASVQVYMS